jgi:flagellar motor protein MotB
MNRRALLGLTLAALAREARAQATAAAIAEAAPLPTWTPRLDAKLLALQRAARGSRIVVERNAHRIRVVAEGDDAFAPNRAELALPLRVFLDEVADDATLKAELRIEVVAGSMPGGIRADNDRLASARAENVIRHLLLRGVPHPRVQQTLAADLAAPQPTGRRVELFIDDVRD